MFVPDYQEKMDHHHKQEAILLAIFDQILQQHVRELNPFPKIRENKYLTNNY